MKEKEELKIKHFFVLFILFSLSGFHNVFIIVKLLNGENINELILLFSIITFPVFFFTFFKLISEKSIQSIEAKKMAINEEYRKEFHFDNLHRFLTAIRKSDMELNISIGKRGVCYRFTNKKSFKRENWNKTLNRMVSENSITKNEAEVFNKMIENLLHYT